MDEVRLKICDLCGALNLVENSECHVCGWRGHFSTEPAKVRSVIEVTRKLQLHETTQGRSLLAALRARVEDIRWSLRVWLNRRRRSPHFPL
jgi:fructose-1,6-bisphosphatase/inositol monophosphatase family enzyme